MIDKSKLAGQKGHLLPPVTEKFKVRLASGTARYRFHRMPSGPGFFHFIPGLASFSNRLTLWLAALAAPNCWTSLLASSREKVLKNLFSPVTQLGLLVSGCNRVMFSTLKQALWPGGLTTLSLVPPLSWGESSAPST